MFSNVCVVVLPVGLGKLRLKTLQRQVKNHNGHVQTNIDDNVTHVIAADELEIDRIRSILIDQELKEQIKIVRVSWLTECLKMKTLIETEPYKVDINEQIRKEEGPKHETTSNESVSQAMVEKRSIQRPDGEEIAGKSADNSSSPSKKGRFVCETSSKDESVRKVNQNQNITSKLQILAEGYKSTNDRWRALSYEKAIKTIENYPQKITSKSQIENLRGIGSRLTEKIWEICQSGTLRKAEEFGQNEKVKTMTIFTNIWGVGPTIAEQWYVQGLRTLEDVKSKANLSRQQKIGMKYYDELLERMPRSEATEIVEKVVSVVNELSSALVCQACGSYRRKRENCGDVDILITHPDGQSHDHILNRLITILTDKGFLTDHLVECHEEDNQKKYMGVCKLPGENRLHRRLDVITVPYDEYSTALIYFTGSAHFTRSIYAKAKSMGMRLNQHGLRGGIMRQAGEKLNDGYLIDTPTERSVFEALDVPYRTPEERDHP